MTLTPTAITEQAIQAAPEPEFVLAYTFARTGNTMLLRVIPEEGQMVLAAWADASQPAIPSYLPLPDGIAPRVDGEPEWVLAYLPRDLLTSVTEFAPEVEPVTGDPKPNLTLTA